MVELVDEHAAKGLGDLTSLRRLLRVKAGRTDLSNLHNANIVVTFEAGLSARNKAEAIDDLLSLLAMLRKRSWGEDLLEDLPIPGIRLCYINRQIGARGPEFEVAIETSFDEISPKAIQSKFRKTYKTEAPIELLAYFLRATPLSGAGPPGPIQELLAREMSTSPFRRLWIYDMMWHEIGFV